MLKDRVLTALFLGAALLTVLFVLPAMAALGVFGAVLALGAWEWAGLGGIDSQWARVGYACAIAIVFIALYAWVRAPDRLLLVYVLACVWWGAAAIWLATAPRFRSRALVLACGVPVIAPCFVAIASVYTSRAGIVRGAPAVLWLFAWVFSADIGGYFAGRALGKRKLAPRVSPSKTWEGVAGGLALSSVFAAAGAWWFGLPLLPVISFGVVLIAFSIVGDLTESMFKRGVGIKDSGRLLPGHGGVMDRIDSLTAAAPLYALGLTAFGASS